MLAAAVGLAAGAGALLRWLVDLLVRRRYRGPLPAGTLLVNVTGCLGLGVVVALAEDDVLAADAALVLAAGLAGGYTTLSTWAWETWELLRRGSRAAAAGYVVVTVVLCLGAGALGLLIG